MQIVQFLWLCLATFWGEGGKQNVLHTKKNVETVEVKTIFHVAAKV